MVAVSGFRDSSITASPTAGSSNNDEPPSHVTFASPLSDSMDTSIDDEDLESQDAMSTIGFSEEDEEKKETSNDDASSGELSA